MNIVKTIPIDTLIKRLESEKAQGVEEIHYKGTLYVSTDLGSIIVLTTEEQF